MELPTDTTRKIAELLKVSTLTAIKKEGGRILVQCETEAGQKSGWMEYGLPFVGNTAMFAYPKVGTGGIVLSESGENHINRFIPLFDIAGVFTGLGETDFKILFYNGDFIHHKGGALTITTSGKATVNAESVEVNATRTTINSSQINLNGNVKVAGSFSQVSGGARSRSGYTASFTAPVTFRAPVYAIADITINGIPFATHKHDTPAGMSSTPQ